MENWFESLYTDGSKYFVSNPLPKKGEEIKIYIRAYEDSPIKGIWLKGSFNGVERLIKMEKEFTENFLCYYSCKVTIYEDELSYSFYIVAEDKIYYYNQRGITEYEPDRRYDFRILTDYDQPKWVKESVFYQIFPERFCNGNPENDVKDKEYYFDGHPVIKVKDWNSVPKEYDEVHCLDFYGGDLEGITQKIPYLKELGINAIYLNPIFYAATVHKYDCLDYFQVDKHFGGDKAFEELMKELHKNGIRLVLDMSINHTGTANKWFNKEGIFFDKSVGAYNNKDAVERNYYFFNEDNSYKAWNDVDTLPTLNYTSKELRNIIFEGEDSLVKKWLKPPYEIDGWRFDVAETMARNNEIQLHHDIWPKIRKSIKDVNKEAYVLAEGWTDLKEFLNGNEWDSAMNYYGFGRPVRDFFGDGELFMKHNPELYKYQTKLTAKNLANRIKNNLDNLPFVIQENQFNLFDSHDVPRLHNNPEISFEKYRGAVIMLFSMIGTPNMYYGDEVGIDGRINSMEGCRYPMPWNEDYRKSKYYKLYQKLISLKVNEDALKYGGFKIISDDDYVFSYARFTRDEVIFVVCSSDDENRKVRIPLKAFGKTSERIIDDLFGKKLDYEKCDDGIILNVESNNSYIFKI